MSTQFKILCTVEVAHAYYSENCQDIRFIIPEDTARRLRNGKLLARDFGGKLYVLFEADDAGTALAAVPGKTLRIGLQLANPYFTNFTEVDADFGSWKQLYRNSAAPAALDPPEKVMLVGQLFSHTLTDGARPVTVTLKDADGQTLQSEVITAAEDRTAVSYDLTGQNPGACSIEEIYPAATEQIAYYFDAELTQAGVFGMLELSIDSSFYNTAAEFELAFAAREETLNYYVLVTAQQASDLNPLSVTDSGFAEDGRVQINFTKIPAASFTAAEISPDLLGDSSKQVVLFRSQAPVARTEKAKKKIQLMKNGEVLISHLPQPRAEESNADLIIPVSKL
ncbi:MAG: hypothetical protein HY735_15050 [Verrucomicrobia bacterium]|nr:hypothetical protein [Verrucomicrobiota bacterium]